MSFNDGKQLLVFGLSFVQHDNRKMQQLLRHYDKLPDNPGNRAILFFELNKVAKDLMADEGAQDQIQQLTDWMTKGGDFPLTIEPTPAGAGVQPQTTQDMTRNDMDFIRNRSLFAGQQGYHGPVDGEWEENENEDEEEDVNASMEEDEDDDEMHHPMVDPRHVDRRNWLDDSARRDLFAGPGRTLSDPPANMGETIAANEDDRTESLNVDGQVVEGPQNQSAEIDHGQPDSDAPGLQHPSRLPQAAENYEARAAPWIQERVDEVTYENGPFMHPDEPDDVEEIECPICLEDYPRSRFPKRQTITELCDHPDKACLNCLDSSITAIIERGALHLLACPICPQKLSPRDVKEYANQAVYERYKYLKQQSEIPGHYISCTNTLCGGSQPHESEDPMMICNHCKSATCAKHRRPWHEGQTCEEFDLDDAQIERLEEEEATAKLLSREDMSICPKCGQGVTKTEGCDHMRCQCGQEWCYVCSCSYENIIRLGPTAHATFCTYHPNKVNLTKTQQEAARKRIMGLVHGGEVSAELSRAREDLRRRRREEIRPKAAEAAEARLRAQLEQNKGQPQPNGPPEKKKRKVKLFAPWEEGGWTKKAL
ncbi:hypothetical protein J7T55_010258 [Diaporthe amygdali]|uniref:uncharacterized protein n=1 Tax=Phomopsis amygdali TaxID=1214568 RepID=UPI0022FE0A38|nr:uncharacterized protein J7T55_010258 [Diaporthe amygdali]KAJ0107653.1 hypothetical protein J7T55_010258 [Diaporthe amygdali]